MIEKGPFDLWIDDIRRAREKEVARMIHQAFQNKKQGEPMSGEAPEEILTLFQDYTNQVHSVVVEEGVGDVDSPPDWEFTKLIATESKLLESIEDLLHEVRAGRNQASSDNMVGKWLRSTEASRAAVEASQAAVENLATLISNTAVSVLPTSITDTVIKSAVTLNELLGHPYLADEGARLSKDWTKPRSRPLDEGDAEFAWTGTKKKEEE